MLKSNLPENFAKLCFLLAKFILENKQSIQSADKDHNQVDVNIINFKEQDLINNE